MSMVAYVIYHADGTIASTGISQESTVEYLVGPGQNLVITNRMADPETEYISNPGTDPVIAPKPAPPAPMVISKVFMSANGTDYVAIPNIPAGSSYAITPPDAGADTAGLTGTIDDGVLEITTTMPGNYQVTVTPLNQQPYKASFNAS